MGDYERSTTLDVDRDEVFEFLSQVENLPAYMDRLTSARAVTGDQVEVEARLDPDHLDQGNGGSEIPQAGHDVTVRGEAWLTVDADQRTLAWGAEGPHDYSGELEVAGDDQSSTVTVRLHTLHDDAAAIENGLDETLANIQRHFASRTSDR